MVRVRLPPAASPSLSGIRFRKSRTRLFARGAGLTWRPGRQRRPEPHHLAGATGRSAAKQPSTTATPNGWKLLTIGRIGPFRKAGSPTSRPLQDPRRPQFWEPTASRARRGCACMHVRTAIAGERSYRPLRHKPLRPRRPLRRNGHRRTSCARRAHGSCAASGRPRSPALWCPAERASAR